MPRIIDRTGEKHGRLLVLGLGGIDVRGNKLCLVRCDCGTEKTIVQSRLTAKHKPARSCGCGSKVNHFRSHNMTHHPLYQVWRAMRGRCYNESNKSFIHYGARGIGICKEWRESPVEFIAWLQANDYKKGLQVDRKDNDGDYSPENCHVVTAKVNANNRRANRFIEIDGGRLTIAQISEKYGVPYERLYSRLFKQKLDIRTALNMKLWSRTGEMA